MVATAMGKAIMAYPKLFAADLATVVQTFIDACGSLEVQSTTSRRFPMASS
jgi:hypothetical protein